MNNFPPLLFPTQMGSSYTVKSYEPADKLFWFKTKSEEEEEARKRMLIPFTLPSWRPYKQVEPFQLVHTTYIWERPNC